MAALRMSLQALTPCRGRSIVEAQLHVPAAWRGQMQPGLSGYVVATSWPQRREAGPTRPRKSAARAR